MPNSDPFSDLIRSIEENLEHDGNFKPPEDEPRRVLQGRPKRWWILLVVLLLLFMLFNVGLGFLTDWIWFDSLGFASVLITRVVAWTLLFAAGTVTAWLIMAFSIWLARRLEPFGLIGTPPEQVAAAFGVSVPAVLLLLALAIAVLMGLGLAGDWQQILLYFNQAPFRVSDPVFNLDISFYVFTLPVWETLRSWLLVVLVMALVAVAVTAGVGWRGWRVRRPVLVQMAVIGALILALIAVQYRFDAYDLLYSTRGAVFGAGYTDVHAQLPAYNLLLFVTLLTGVVLVVAAWLRRGLRAIGIVIGVWIAVAIIAGMIYPAFVQRFQVAPSELNLEKPYIIDNIQYTRLGFGLDKITETSYDASAPLTAAAVKQQPDSVRNMRLWDYRPILQTYNQIQALRQYYEFNDVDVDRYVVDGRRRQVTIAARELAPDKLSADAQTWYNRRLVYTHGYGVAMSPVSRIAEGGLPEFYLQNLPVTGVFTVTTPQVYFGEVTNDYVVGRTRADEFDYPQGNGFVTTKFMGDSGIQMSMWNRLLFALRFADINLLLSQDIMPDSQLLWRRNIVQRVTQLAPFLQYDRDPYIVVGDDGRLYWLLDAYTTTDRYPYSDPAATGANYMRNPVKVVVDAYSGRVTFYIFDDQEPIAATYRKIYPALFKPYQEMPQSLLAHIRYPNDLFTVQADMYRTYHMTNPIDFYNREDMWAWPEEVMYNETQRIEPYYVLMQLPNEDSYSYLQIVPFTPANRQNMTAWMAAHSDLANYGQILTYTFGRDSLVFGPQQVEGRIDQDPTISAQLTLWNQQGSSVIRGNLLVLPIDDSLLYVEPLYLQGQSGRIPELKRVIVATQDRVVMAEDLGLALIKLFGADTLTAAGLTDLLSPASEAGVQAAAGAAAPAAAASLGSASLEQLIVQANDHYNRGQELLRSGDWAGYGAEMSALQDVLRRLVQVSGVSLPTPAAPISATTGPAAATPAATGAAQP